MLVEVEAGEQRVEVAQERDRPPAAARGSRCAGTCAASRGRCGARLITGSRPSNRPFACGARREKAIRVGESCLAAGTSWRNSGSALSAKVLSRSKVSRCSSSKVGKARNSASMSRLRAAVVLKTAFELRIRLASWPFAAAQRAEGRRAVAEQLLHGEPLRVEHPEQAVEFGESGVELGERGGERLALAGDRRGAFLHPFLEGGAGPLVEGAEDLVELHRFGHVGPRQAVAVVQGRAVPVAGRQFDVGLAEQRLRPQDRPRAPRQRRVLVFDVDRRLRLLAVGRLFDRLHLADRDAGDPHVGLFGELGRLLEGDLDLVRLRLERRRPAEGDPEEEQDAEARQGEAGDDEELRGAGGFLAHYSALGRIRSARRGCRDEGDFCGLRGSAGPAAGCSGRA